MSDTAGPGAEGPHVVALGGGHGLAASLSALRRVTGRVTAVVTVADDGGSSGRLRRELGVLPPGDLRMALAALCGDDDWGQTWSRVVQHRFRSQGDLHDHALGNLLIVALWELLGDSVEGLDWVGRLLGAQGRVLPMSVVPLDIEALIEETSYAGADPAGAQRRVRGQVEVATATGRVISVRLLPEDPPACEEALAAVREADWVVLGPGSWFTSVIPHLLVPELAAALRETPARRLVALNLEPQPGETSGFAPETYLEALQSHAPGLRLDVVLADPKTVSDMVALERVASSLGAEVVLAPLARSDGTPRHDVELFASAYRDILSTGRI
ncbi:MAG: gluconeogenesis factor YvcK family protein [Actinomycetes bacterium]